MDHFVNVSTNVSSKEEETCVAIFRSIMRSHNMLHGIGTEVAGQFGLQLAELNVIDMLGREGPLTMGALSRVTFIAPSSTTRTVARLESRGLVERRRAQDSAREVLVSLTRKGRNLFRKAYPQVLESVQHHLAVSMNRGERQTLAKLLQRLTC